MRPTLLAGSLALALTACTSTLDVDRARRWFETPEEPALPAFQETHNAELPSPEGLRATSGELRAVPLRWDPLLGGNVGGYVAERARQREGPFERIAAVAGQATTAYLDTGARQWPGEKDSDVATELGDGETLFYRVRAFSSGGELAKAASAVVAATTASPPDPPEGLRAYSHQPREVPLAWRASADLLVAGYVIERGPSARGPFGPLAEIDGRHQTVYVDRGLGDLRVFYYRVSSLNTAGGRGEPSNPVRAVTKPEPLPPIDLRIVARRLGANELAWEPNVEPDLAGYQLLRIREGGEAPELVASPGRDRIQATDREVSADERVSYTVVAIDRDGLESAAAEPISVQSEGYALAATVRSEGVHLQWKPRSEEGYRGARIFLLGTLGQTELAFVKGSSYVHTDVKAGRRYRYAVTLERSDASPAPSSSPVEIRIPKR
jgi:fibronectin type 3 domain-containing protein